MLTDESWTSQWKLTRIDGHRYEITQDGGVAIEKNGGLVLSGEDDEKPVWRIEAVPHQGENAYMCAKSLLSSIA